MYKKAVPITTWFNDPSDDALLHILPVCCPDKLFRVALKPTRVPRS